MRAVINFLTAHLRYIILIYIAVQIAYIFLFPLPFKSDSLYYFNLALSSINSGSFYPSTIHLHEDYIIAPLFVNLQILVLKIYNSTYSIGLFHLALNLLQLYILSSVAKKYYGKQASAVFTVLYMLYLPNIGFLLLNMTELLFGVLVGSALLFLLSEKKSGFLISGLLSAASVSVRPLGWALILGIILFHIFISDSERLRSIITYVLGIFIFFIIIGTLTFISSGQFIFTSVNYGTNFLIGANDDASGAYNEKVFSEGNIGFIENPTSLTYSTKQKFWFDQAVTWIKNNKFEWIKVFPLKLTHIFIWDDYAVSPLLHMQDWNLYKFSKALIIDKNIEQFFETVPLYQQISYIALQIIHHIYYFLIVIMFLFVVIKRFSALKSDKLSIAILLLTVVSIIIPLLSFGDPRFKYPYILLMIMLISPFISNYFQKNKIKTNTL